MSDLIDRPMIPTMPISPTQALKNYKVELVRHAIKNFRDKTPNQDLTGVEMLRELRSDKALASQ